MHQSLQNAESWINRSVQGSSTSSSASSTLSHGEGKGTSGSLADVFANTRIGRSWVRTERSLRVQTVLIKSWSCPLQEGNSERDFSWYGWNLLGLVGVALSCCCFPEEFQKVEVVVKGRAGSRSFWKQGRLQGQCGQSRRHNSLCPVLLYVSSSWEPPWAQSCPVQVAFSSVS